jgi:hypothetical protein
MVDQKTGRGENPRSSISTMHPVLSPHLRNSIASKVILSTLQLNLRSKTEKKKKPKSLTLSGFNAACGWLSSGLFVLPQVVDLSREQSTSSVRVRRNIQTNFGRIKPAKDTI